MLRNSLILILISVLFTFGQTPKTLSVRNAHALGYDENLNKIILFGGADSEFVFGDTWEFDGKSWKKIIAVRSQKRIENGH
jgi:hypothetical protein